MFLLFVPNLNRHNLCFLQKITQAVFFADCAAPGPTLFFYKNTSSIYFSGDITDMVFLLIVQDLTWYNKQKHHYNM